MCFVMYWTHATPNQLPSCVWNLTQLTHLDVAFCRLSSVRFVGVLCAFVLCFVTRVRSVAC
jgi:hypothetical protein